MRMVEQYDDVTSRQWHMAYGCRCMPRIAAAVALLRRGDEDQSAGPKLCGLLYNAKTVPFFIRPPGIRHSECNNFQLVSTLLRKCFEPLHSSGVLKFKFFTTKKNTQQIGCHKFSTIFTRCRLDILGLVFFTAQNSGCKIRQPELWQRLCVGCVERDVACFLPLFRGSWESRSGSWDLD
jgi:hypothetical protein